MSTRAFHQRDDESEPFECPLPITCQFPRCDCISEEENKEKLMTCLRNSVIDARARALYTVVTVATEEDAIEIIKLALRVERDEGIKAGIEQKERFSEELMVVAS